MTIAGIVDKNLLISAHCSQKITIIGVPIHTKYASVVKLIGEYRC
uniref:Uncharacterized protein n=1 Tax=Parascaris equorum TaxID=6256 RepID=A0A914S6D1_PAREQ